VDLAIVFTVCHSRQRFIMVNYDLFIRSEPYIQLYHVTVSHRGIFERSHGILGQTTAARPAMGNLLNKSTCTHATRFSFM
jgi:hypothetical protein